MKEKVLHWLFVFNVFKKGEKRGAKRNNRGQSGSIHTAEEQAESSQVSLGAGEWF
jgi:hypothetical protein